MLYATRSTCITTAYSTINTVMTPIRTTVSLHALVKKQFKDRQVGCPKAEQTFRCYIREICDRQWRKMLCIWIFPTELLLFFFSQGNMLSLKPMGTVGSRWQICTAWLQLCKPWNSKAEAKSPLSTSGTGAETRNLQKSLHFPFLSASDFLTFQ